MMDESEALQDDLMQEIAAKEKDLKQAKYDEYLAKLAHAGGKPALQRLLDDPGVRLYHHQSLRNAYPPDFRHPENAQRH